MFKQTRSFYSIWPSLTIPEVELAKSEFIISASGYSFVKDANK